MSKRNLILITIVLVIIAAIASIFLFFNKPSTNNTNGGATGGINFLSNLFPFGKSNTKNTGNGTNPVDVSGYVTPITGVTPKELLTKISSMPIAGYGVFLKERFKDIPTPTPVSTTPNTNTANTDVSTTPTKDKAKTAPIIKPTAPLTEFVPSLRYVEKATGNIYQTFADKINEQKFTTTIIPTVYDAYFGDNGNSVVMRYLNEDGNTIESFVGTMPKEILGEDTSVSNELVGSFLPENIKDISVSPDSSSIFYLFNSGESTLGTTATASGDKKNQIFNSPFNEWLSQWPNDRMITLNTKPSFTAPGFMYFIDPTVKKINKILGDIKGLTTLTSPNGKLILYNDNNLSLHIYNTDTSDSMSIGIKTMPEKCTWNSGSSLLYCAVPKYISGSNYPDVWYQGEISFSDNIWKISIENGEAKDIADPTSFTNGEDIDGIKLSLDSNGNYLFFINKKDSYLWELNIQ